MFFTTSTREREKQELAWFSSRCQHWWSAGQLSSPYCCHNVRNLLSIHMSPHRPTGRAKLLAAHSDCAVLKELAAAGRHRGCKANTVVLNGAAAHHPSRLRFHNVEMGLCVQVWAKPLLFKKNVYIKGFFSPSF